MTHDTWMKQNHQTPMLLCCWRYINKILRVRLILCWKRAMWWRKYNNLRTLICKPSASYTSHQFLTCSCLWPNCMCSKCAPKLFVPLILQIPGKQKHDARKLRLCSERSRSRTSWAFGVVYKTFGNHSPESVGFKNAWCVSLSLSLSDFVYILSSSLEAKMQNRSDSSLVGLAMVFWQVFRIVVAFGNVVLRGAERAERERIAVAACGADPPHAPGRRHPHRRSRPAWNISTRPDHQVVWESRIVFEYSHT